MFLINDLGLPYLPKGQLRSGRNCSGGTSFNAAFPCRRHQYHCPILNTEYWIVTLSVSIDLGLLCSSLFQIDYAPRFMSTLDRGLGMRRGGVSRGLEVYVASMWFHGRWPFWAEVHGECVSGVWRWGGCDEGTVEVALGEGHGHNFGFGVCDSKHPLPQTSIRLTYDQ